MEKKTNGLNSFDGEQFKDTKKRYIKPESVKELESMALGDSKRKYPNFPYPSKPKYRDDTSNGLTKCVIDMIRLNGFQAERINSTGRVLQKSSKAISIFDSSRNVKSGKWIKGSSTNGTADISATIKGRSVKIEIKCKATGDHYQSADQKKYQKEVERAGGVYIIVRDFDSFLEWLKAFIRDGE